MSLNEDVDLEEFIMAKDDLSGADIKAVCTEAGLLALRERRMRVNKADFTAAREKVGCFKYLSGVCCHRTLILFARSCTGRTRVRRKACTCDWLSEPFLYTVVFTFCIAPPALIRHQRFILYLFVTDRFVGLGHTRV